MSQLRIGDRVEVYYKGVDSYFGGKIENKTGKIVQIIRNEDEFNIVYRVKIDEKGEENCNEIKKLDSEREGLVLDVRENYLRIILSPVC